MKKRNMSFLVIGIIYVLSFLWGYLAFMYVDTLPAIYRFLIGDVVATLWIYICSMILKNASLYDPYWSVIPPFILIGAALYYQSFGFAVIMMIVALSIWAIRLTYNWASLWHGFTEMDWRYQAMKEKAPKLYFLTNLFGIQLFPTAIVFVQLAAAIFFIELNPSANLLTWGGALMILCAALIQFIADEQMKKFKERTKGERKCIEEGLWKYSRHPNYFGEVTVWWGLYMMYFSIFGFDLMMISPIMMTSLFLFISIPWMEKKILMTRPEYRSYQKRVSMLIPFFRKEEEQSPSIKHA